MDNAVVQKYKSSYTAAGKDLLIHTLVTGSSYYLLWYLRNSILSILTVPLLSLLLVKTFIIFHDCGHNSYTPSKTVNTILGSLLGSVVVTPYSWNFVHATHHVSSGRMNNEYGFAHMDVLATFNQYKHMSIAKKRLIQCIFSPYVLFPFVSNVLFMIYNRIYILNFLLVNCMNTPSLSYLLFDQLLHNLGIGLIMFAYYYCEILPHCLIATAISGTLGTLLFFNQHTYNTPYIVENEAWTMRESGLKGSSFIQIPWYLKYFTGGIEYHHIHHYNSKIPGYNLQALHEEVVQTSDVFDQVVKLSMRDCYKNMWLSVYDEDAKRYITFAEADTRLESK